MRKVSTLGVALGMAVRSGLSLVCLGASGRFEKRRADGGWDLDGDEAIGSEEVVLAALVHDTDLSMPLGIFVADGDVDLVLLEGRPVASAPHTDDEGASASRGIALP